MKRKIMESRIILLAILITLSGCSIKMKTDHLSDGTIVMKDNVMGMNMTLKQKDGYCLKDAKFSDMDGDIEFELDKYCNVLSGKVYHSNGIIVDLPKENIEKATDAIKNYLDNRKNISQNNPLTKTPNNDTDLSETRRNRCKASGGVPSWDFKKDRFLCKGIE